MLLQPQRGGLKKKVDARKSGPSRTSPPITSPPRTSPPRTSPPTESPPRILALPAAVLCISPYQPLNVIDPPEPQPEQTTVMEEEAASNQEASLHIGRRRRASEKIPVPRMTTRSRVRHEAKEPDVQKEQVVGVVEDEDVVVVEEEDQEEEVLEERLKEKMKGRAKTRGKKTKVQWEVLRKRLEEVQEEVEGEVEVEEEAEEGADKVGVQELEKDSDLYAKFVDSLHKQPPVRMTRSRVRLVEAEKQCDFQQKEQEVAEEEEE